MNKLRLLACLATLLCMAPVFAGQTCEERELAPNELKRGFDLALATRDALDAAGAEVVILARAGQDLSRWGLAWSHAGIAWRDHPSGRWVVTHLLNHCGAADSGLYTEGLANFFADNPVRWEALAIVPPAEVQSRMAATLAGGQPLAFHHPAYNMVAYPFSTRYQNSNQWVIELLADALAGQNFMTRTEAQAWLQFNGYSPSPLNIPAVTRLGARMFRANIAFDDHPPEQRWAGRIDTVSVESLAQFMTTRGARQLRITYQPGKRARPASPPASPPTSQPMRI